jgi:glycerol-3-phosphate dehydrogenase
MPRDLANHYGRLYGARTRTIVGNAASLSDLGQHFGGNLYAAEVRYLVEKEWAQTAEDVIWRRTKESLRLTPAQKAAFSEWFDTTFAKAA